MDLKINTASIFFATYFRPNYTGVCGEPDFSANNACCEIHAFAARGESNSRTVPLRRVLLPRIPRVRARPLLRPMNPHYLHYVAARGDSTLMRSVRQGRGRGLGDGSGLGSE